MTKTEKTAVNPNFLPLKVIDEVSSKVLLKKVNFMKSKLLQKGVTLIEALMVLGVMLGMATIGYNLYQKANESSKTNKVINEVALVQQAIGRMYQSSPDVSAISNAVLSTANAWPSTMVSSGAGTAGAVIKNSFGGDVTVTKSGKTTSPLNATNYYEVVFTNIPQQACVDLANATASNFYVVTVNSTDVKTTTALTATPAAVSTACNQLSTNTLTFYGKP